MHACCMVLSSELNVSLIVLSNGCACMVNYCVLCVNLIVAYDILHVIITEFVHVCGQHGLWHELFEIVIVMPVVIVLPVL